MKRNIELAGAVKKDACSSQPKKKARNGCLGIRVDALTPIVLVLRVDIRIRKNKENTREP